MDLAPVLKKYKLKASPEVQERLALYIQTLVHNICSMLAALTLFYSPRTKKVTPQIIKHSLDYVKSVCYPELSPKKGGSYVIDGEYFGADSGAYTETATKTVLSQTIDFQNNLARAQVGGTPRSCGMAGGGCDDRNDSSQRKMTGGCGCAGAVQMTGGCGCAGAVQMGGSTTYSITEFTEMVLEEQSKTTFMGVDMIPFFEAAGVTISDSSLDIVKQVLRMHLHCLFYDLQQVKGKLTVKKLEEVAAKKSHSIFN